MAREPIVLTPDEEKAAKERERLRDVNYRRTQAAREAKALKDARKIQLLGPRIVDPNSPGAIAVREWRDDVISALGGEDAITPQKRALLDAASVTMLAIKRLDDLVLISAGSLVNANTMELAPFVLQREALVAGLRADLKMIGLGRRAKPIHDLGEILATTEDDTSDDSTTEDT